MVNLQNEIIKCTVDDEYNLVSMLILKVHEESYIICIRMKNDPMETTLKMGDK